VPQRTGRETDRFETEFRSRCNERYISLGHCTVIVTILLVPPQRLAVTLVVEPEVALVLTVPDPAVMEGMTEVFEILQVTLSVTSCCVPLPENVAFAVKVTA
jgi:hypothetical protein